MSDLEGRKTTKEIIKEVKDLREAVKKEKEYEEFKSMRDRAISEEPKGGRKRYLDGFNVNIEASLGQVLGPFLNLSDDLGLADRLNDLFVEHGFPDWREYVPVTVTDVADWDAVEASDIKVLHHGPVVKPIKLGKSGIHQSLYSDTAVTVRRVGAYFQDRPYSPSILIGMWRGVVFVWFGMTLYVPTHYERNRIEELAEYVSQVVCGRSRRIRMVAATDGELSLQSRLPIGPARGDAIIDDGLYKSVLREYGKWINYLPRLAEAGMTYTRNMLFHGPPGNGKTSIITALLSHFGVDGFFVSPPTHSNWIGELRSVLSEAEACGGAVIFEDLDRILKTETYKHCGMESDFLSVLDGGLAKRSLSIFATANDISAIPGAILKRPGRFDRIIEVNAPGIDKKNELLSMIYGKLKIKDGPLLPEEDDRVKRMSMAAVKEISMRVLLDENFDMEQALSDLGGVATKGVMGF